MAHSGFPEDRYNYETQPCGCEKVRIGFNRYMKVKWCAEHPKPVKVAK